MLGFLFLFDSFEGNDPRSFEIMLMVSSLTKRSLIDEETMVLSPVSGLFGSKLVAPRSGERGLNSFEYRSGARSAREYLIMHIKDFYGCSSKDLEQRIRSDIPATFSYWNRQGFLAQLEVDFDYLIRLLRVS